MRRIVIPGEELGQAKPGRLPFGVFKEGDKLYSAVFGIAEPEKGFRVTRLNGRYLPRVGDVVIGIVLFERHNGYLVDINGTNPGNLSIPRHLGERAAKLNPGDVITVKISGVNEAGEISLEGPRRLIKGKLIEVKSTKIPRIFGKSGSMLQMIKTGTNVQMIVGKNGRIWLRGDINDIMKAEKIIRFIEENAHMYGVTDAVKNMLEGDDDGDKSRNKTS